MLKIVEALEIAMVMALFRIENRVFRANEGCRFERTACNIGIFCD